MRQPNFKFPGWVNSIRASEELTWIFFFHRKKAIVCRDEEYERYRRSSDFIRKHIFPGGHMPSVAAIREALPERLAIIDVRMMGAHYVPTLDIWRR